MDEPGQLGEIVGHQGDVGCFDSGIAAGGAHGYSERGTTKRGGVVDTVDGDDPSLGVPDVHPGRARQ